MDEEESTKNDEIQTHDSTFYFIKNPQEQNPGFLIRETGYRPKTLDELAEGDASRTHFTVWAASVILARWVARDLAQGSAILELGAGCGLAGIAAFRCCKPTRVLLTDLEIKDHLTYNIRAAKKKVAKASKKTPPSSVSALALNWLDAKTFPEDWISQTDVLIGSDLVYDSDLVKPLVDTCARLARPHTGLFYYVTACTDRAGMDAFLLEMKAYFVLESKEAPPEEFLVNPLGEDKQDLFDLHLSELRDVEHMMYRFRRF